LKTPKQGGVSARQNGASAKQNAAFASRNQTTVCGLSRFFVKSVGAPA
jgi:hypothetical protein